MDSDFCALRSVKRGSGRGQDVTDSSVWFRPPPASTLGGGRGKVRICEGCPPTSRYVSKLSSWTPVGNLQSGCRTVGNIEIGCGLLQRFLHFASVSCTLIPFHALCCRSTVAGMNGSKVQLTTESNSQPAAGGVEGGADLGAVRAAPAAGRVGQRRGRSRGEL